MQTATGYFTMKKITLDCGCEFDVVDGKIDYKPDFNNLNLNCSATWDLICDGNTKGIFQLESFLGEHYAKKAQPRSIEELAALVSLIRPACLQAKMEDGKSLTDHYIMRKMGEEDPDFIVPELAEIVGDTYGILCFQEQASRIGMDLAGLSESDADQHIRKVIGKKLVDKMPETKALLKKGMSENGIDPVASERIISWIEAAQRYSFNKSHSVSYSIISYLTAYLKAHFPLQFYTKYLKHAKHRLGSGDEIKQLIRSAKKQGIYVRQPNIQYCNKEYELIDGSIYIGLTDIKHVGDSDYKYIQDNCKCIQAATWFEMLIFHLPKIKRNSAEALIDAGALDHLFDSRKRAKFELKSVLELKPKEKLFLEPLDPDISLQDGIKLLLDNGYKYKQETGIVSKQRIKKVQDIYNSLTNPVESMDYTEEQIEQIEINLLNFSVSVSPVGSNMDAAMANTRCIDFENSQKDWNITISGKITNYRLYTNKEGSEMCFMSIEDETCELSDIVIFEKTLKKVKHKIYNGALVFIKGNRSRTRDRNSLVVNDLEEI